MLQIKVSGVCLHESQTGIYFRADVSEANITFVSQPRESIADPSQEYGRCIRASPKLINKVEGNKKYL
jgi:hypothetical protein